MTTATEALKTEMAELRQRLLDSLAGVTEEQFRRRPTGMGDGENAWCISEVLAHLLATEKLWAGRIDRALREDGAAIEPTDPALNEAQARAGRLSPVPQLTHGLIASGRELEALIDRAGQEADGFERGLAHPRRGRVTVQWIIETYAIGHLREHVAQIEAAKLAIGADAPKVTEQR
jgi:uncharacterized damage-inducible protein DinB